jgi:hypothetical protein
MGDRQEKGDRRSWKNILINRRYQLRFTLFMVGLSTLLMLSMGYWVLREARKATTVGNNNAQVRDCEELARRAGSAGAAVAPDAPSAAARQTDIAARGSAPGQGQGDDEAKAGDEAAPKTTTETATETTTDTEARPAGEAAAQEPETELVAGEEPGQGAEAERERPDIQVEIGTMQIEPPPPSAVQDARPPPIDQAILDTCLRDQAAKIARLKSGYQRLQMVLLAFGVLMVLGLTLYGIKTTHKVAGPLFKVTLYFEKLRKGKYDRVYNLRKGDQLVEFYDQFKDAHAGLESMQKKDIEVLRGMLEAAEKADLRSRSPEIAALLDELRETLERKEKSLE